MNNYIDNNWFTHTTSTKTKEDITLTVEKIQKLINTWFPILYYELDTNIEKGSFYKVKETDWNPEFIIVHPEDFEIVSNVFRSTRRLVHIKDKP
jgi:hypothetical protein